MIWACAPAEIEERSEAITPNRERCPSRSLAPGVLQEAHKNRDFSRRRNDDRA